MFSDLEFSSNFCKAICTESSCIAHSATNPFSNRHKNVIDPANGFRNQFYNLTPDGAHAS